MSFRRRARNKAGKPQVAEARANLAQGIASGNGWVMVYDATRYKSSVAIEYT